MRPLRCVTDPAADLPAGDPIDRALLGGLKASHFVRQRDATRYVINAWDLMPGDVILYEATGAAGDAIRIFQAGIPNCRNVGWSHVSLYAGDGQVWESLYGRGVENRGFNTSTNGRTIAVRRLPGVQAAFRDLLDDHLINEVGVAYGTRKLRNLLLELGRRYFNTRVPVNLANPDKVPAIRDAAICSQLIKRIYFQVAGVSLLPGKIMLPVDFADDPGFVDIDLRWEVY